MKKEFHIQNQLKQSKEPAQQRQKTKSKNSSTNAPDASKKA